MAQNNFKVKTGIEMPSLDTFVYTDQTQIPSVSPSLNLDFTTKQLDPRITFSRADATACATYTDALGLIKTAPANVPRFDHDPITGKCLGLLIEESRTNLCNYSSVFTSWNSAGVGISFTAGQTDPTGGTGAYILTESSSADYGYIYSNAISYAAAENICASAYVKKDTVPRATRNVLFRIRFGNSARDLEVYLDTSTGEIGTGSDAGMTIAGSGVVDCGGWWRIWVAGTHPTTASTANIHIYPAVGTNFGTSVATTGSITIWGAQLERGEFPTSYIDVPSTTAITRAADLAAITGTNFTSFYNQFESTVGVEFGLQFSTPNSQGRILDFNDTTDTNRNSLYYNIYRNIIFFANDNGVQYNMYTDSSTNPVTFKQTKFCLALKDYDSALAVEGNINGNMTNTTGTIATNMTRMQIGTYPTNNNSVLCGCVKTIKYYPKRLSNAEIQALSTL